MIKQRMFVLAMMSVFLALPVLSQDAAPVAPGLEDPATVAEVVKDVKDGKPEGMPTVVWIGMLMALIGKFCLTLIRKWGYLLGKQAMRIAWLAIGLVVAVGAKMGMGMEWWEAAYLGLSTGPGSALAHEALKLLSPSKWAKDKAPAEA